MISRHDSKGVINYRNSLLSPEKFIHIGSREHLRSHRRIGSIVQHLIHNAPSKRQCCLKRPTSKAHSTYSGASESSDWRKSGITRIDIQWAHHLATHSLYFLDAF